MVAATIRTPAASEAAGKACRKAKVDPVVAVLAHSARSGALACRGHPVIKVRVARASLVQLPVVRALAAQARLLWVSVAPSKRARAKGRSIETGLVKMVAAKVGCPDWHVQAVEGK